MDKKKYEDKSFWLALGLIAILSFIVIIISAEDGTIPVGAAVSSAERQQISFLAEGKTIYIQARHISGLSVVELTAKENIKDVNVIIERAEGEPFSGNVYSAFTIRSVPEEFSGAFSLKLLFKLPQQELDALGIGAGQLQLFINGRETPLAALDLVRTAEGYLAYEAQTSELGSFVLGAAEEPSMEEPLAPPQLLPEMQEGIMPEDIIQEYPAQDIIIEQAEYKPSFLGNLWKSLKDIFS